jgi:beta-glucanase (GH16 family)
MSKSWLHAILAPAALAGSALLLVNCGGGGDNGGGGGTTDTTAPTMVITDNVSAANASGDVTFTFTFSEAVTTAFNAGSITVTGATKGAFARTSATVATLVTSLTPGNSGTINVTVPVGAFTDLAGNASKVAVSANQAYAPGQMNLPVTFDNLWMSYGVAGYDGAEDSSIIADPAQASNKIVRVTKSATADAQARTVITTVDPAGFASEIPFASNAKKLRVKVQSPDAGVTVRLKVEEHANTAVAASAEAITTQAGAWETLVFDFASPAAGSAALDTSKNYDLVTLYFNYGQTGAQAGSAKTYYFDDLEMVPADWQLVWSDEFTTDGVPNPAKWRFEVGENWANEELQAYTSNSRNGQVANGSLIITAIPETSGSRNYSSARINSIGSWTYGRMDVRAMLPMGHGLWPAIWMLPDSIGVNGNNWPDCGELDIMEQNWIWNQSDTLILGTVHNGDYNFMDGSQKSGSITVTAPSANWHVYSMVWYQDQVSFLVDDQQYFTYYSEGTHGTWPYDNPFHFILNIAVDGATATVGTSTWSKPTMEIDYVRVYSGSQAGPSPLPYNLPGKVEAENWTRMQGVATETCAEGTLNVGWMDAKDFLEYTINVPVAGTYPIRFRVASMADAGFNVLLDGTSTLTMTFPTTGGWQTWTTLEQNITLPAGEHTLRIAPTAGFNLNWFEVLD